MNIEKSRLISEAAPHLNASLGTINGNEFAAIVPVIPGHIGGRETNIEPPRFSWRVFYL